MADRVVIEANANFHHIGGADLFEKGDKAFLEYRKKWQENPEKFFVGGFPLFLDIEVTSSCNLKCPFCATTFRNNKIEKGFISESVVNKIIDEGAEKGLYGVKFNIRGEPLLHPQICAFVSYAKRKGLIDVYFNTNAMLLTETIARGLIEAGLDRLSISLDGYTKEQYESNRVGANFETVLANIDCLQKLKKKLKVTHPKVRGQTVMLPEIQADLENYKNFWMERVDELAYLDYKDMKDKKTGIEYPWACPQLWQRMAIWWDGTILPCNHDDEGLLCLGNTRDTTIEQAWHSQELGWIRAAHQAGQSHQIPACDGCYLRDSEILKLKKGK